MKDEIWQLKKQLLFFFKGVEDIKTGVFPALYRI